MTLLEGKTQVLCLHGAPSFGEERLDLDQRCVTGGGVTITLRDTDDEVLLATFAPRARPSSHLTANVLRGTAMTGAGVVSVSSTSGFQSAGVFHVGAEAFTYTGKTSTTFTGVTRSAYGTSAQDHFGGLAADAGAAVTPQPQSWTGRRVTVKAGYKRADGTVAELETIGTYRLGDVPKPGPGDEWVMDCGPLSDRFRDARCYVGLRDVADIGANGGSGIYGDSFTAAEFGAAQQFVVRGAPVSHVLATTQHSGIFSLRLMSAELGSTLTVEWPELLSPTPGEVLGDGVRAVATNLRHVALLQGHPVDILLALLTSIEGDGTNGTSDVLPGITRGAYGGPQWQFGAGIPAAEINIDGGDAAPGEGSIYWLRGLDVEWTHLLVETLEVGELLREFCVATGAYWYLDGDGRLSFGRMRDSAPPSLTVQGPTIDDDTALWDSDGDARPSEQRAVHTVRMRTNYQPIAGEHTVRVSVTDWELRNRFPQAAQELVVESKFLHVDARAYALAGAGQRIVPGTIMTPENVAAALRRALLERSRAEVIVTEAAAWNALGLRVGRFVELGNPRLPDLEGSRLSSARALIIARRPDPETASISLTMRVVDSANLIAPYGAITNVTSTYELNDTVTLDPNDPSCDPALDSPVEAFAVGNTLEVYHASTGDIEEAEILELDAVAHTIVVQTAGIPSTATGCWPKIGNSGTTNAADYGEDDFAVMQAAGGSDPRTRWS